MPAHQAMSSPTPSHEAMASAMPSHSAIAGTTMGSHGTGAAAMTNEPILASHVIVDGLLHLAMSASGTSCDVDLDGKTAVISQQLQQYDGRLAISSPKTPHSTRVIALDHTTIAALRAHRDRQRAEAAAYRPGYRASGFVFTDSTGPDGPGPADPDLPHAGHGSGPAARPAA